MLARTVSLGMIVSDIGTWRSDLNLSDPWWIRVTADSHAVVILNNWWNTSVRHTLSIARPDNTISDCVFVNTTSRFFFMSHVFMQPSFTPRQSHRTYNGTGTDNKVVVARALKAHNPNVKVYFYQPADRLGDTVYVQNVLKSHPGVLQDHMKILTRTHCTHLGIISYSLTGTLLECINTHTHTHTHTHTRTRTHTHVSTRTRTNTNAEWWLRDDYGNIIWFGGPNGRPQIDTSVVAAQDFFANLSVSLFHVPGEAKRLLDGVMVRISGLLSFF